MNEPISAMNHQDALIAVMLLTALADDRLSDREIAEIESSMAILPVFEGYNRNSFDGVVDTVKAFLEEDDGLESLIELIATVVPNQLHETAYALACDTAAADRSVALGEMRMLEELRHGLGLDRLNAAAIERGSRARHMKLK